MRAGPAGPAAPGHGTRRASLRGSAKYAADPRRRTQSTKREDIQGWPACVGWKVEEIYRCFIAIRADLRLGELALHAGLARDGMQVADTQQLNLRRGVRVGGISAFPRLPACCSSTQVGLQAGLLDGRRRAGRRCQSRAGRTELADWPNPCPALQVLRRRSSGRSIAKRQIAAGRGQQHQVAGVAGGDGEEEGRREHPHQRRRPPRRPVGRREPRRRHAPLRPTAIRRRASELLLSNILLTQIRAPKAIRAVPLGAEAAGRGGTTRGGAPGWACGPGAVAQRSGPSSRHAGRGT